MSEIKELIERLCPDGVEWKTMKDLCILQRGKVYSKKFISENVGDYPVYSSQTANNGILGKINSYDYDGNYLTWTTDGAYAGTIFYRTGKFSITNVCGLIKPKNKDINLRFLYYWLSLTAKKYVYQGMGNPKLMSNQVEEIEIPVPPIEVQRKIVEILDNFTELEAELERKLEAELEARRKQYEYYRNQLLTFDDTRSDVKWMKISDIGTFTRGKRFVRTDIVEDGIPCIHYGDMYTYYGLKADKAKTHLTPEKAQKMRFAKRNDVVIVGAGENKIDIGVGVAWLGEENVAVHDACYIFSSDLYPQYVSHFLRTELYHKQIYPLVSEGKICSISAQNIGRAIIPIPPLEEQKRIVAILDRFEALTTDLQSGLPAEIEARRKQYEYYREKLLNFKRL